ncbi:hypothetical protein PIB30_005618 [Stylosanthes scabra]|uniref:Replication factor A C-terminal domain-containing protein n=1 Tax=Stylosanthes scabra TaxID=79078 RepID=A0ABU6S479_9FABA|nr:hypothetical protein [Stylosanthes scabra]
MEINGYSYPTVVLDLYAHGKKIQCNIVGDLAQVVDQRVLPMYQRPPVILLQYFKCKFDKVVLQNVVHVSRISINPDIKETVDFLNNYDIGQHYFPRLQPTNIGSLISQIDDPSFDWKLLRTVMNLKSTTEDGVFFLVGKIMEVVDDPEWWYFSCVCGHPIIGDDNVFRCQTCSKDVEHFTVNYRVKVLIEDGTSISLFVLLDAAVTKLIGKTCSEAFLVPDTKTQFSYCSPLFKNLLGQEKIFKVNQVPTRIPIHVDAIKELLDDVISVKVLSTASRNINISFFLGSVVSIDRAQRWYFLPCLCGTPISHVAGIYYCPSCGIECVNALPSYRLKIIVSHLNGNNIFILDDPEVSQIVNMECSDLLKEKPNEPMHDFIVPDLLPLKIIGREFVFIVDPRPIGYESNISVHFVRAITDDPSIIKFSRMLQTSIKRSLFH